MTELRRVVKAKPPPTMSTFLPSSFSQGIPVAQRSTNPHDVADLHVMQVTGVDHAGFIDGEFNKSFFHRGRGDADGDFTLAGNGQFSELSGPVGEFGLVFGLFDKNKFERF